MPLIDSDRLLQEVSPDQPCGENLEYDPAFGELERAAETKPATQFGEQEIPAQPPNWAEVKEQALEMFARTKDLRVAMLLLRSLLHTEGLPGLGAGLRLLLDLLKRYWGPVHPQLDPADSNDPTLRASILSTLFNQEMMLRPLKEAPLVSMQGFGAFGLRDLQVASGKLVLPATIGGNKEPPKLSDIDGAFDKVGLEKLQATAGAIGECIEGFKAVFSWIEASAPEISGSEAWGGSAERIPELNRILTEAQAVLAERLSRRGIGAPGIVGAGEGMPGGGEVPVDASLDPNAEAPAPPGGHPQQVAGIRSREDIIRHLDMICSYLERNEPSSPVPLLLQRAKRLVSKSFLEIIKDMAPAGVSQAELIGGLESENS